jgi:hypothetical protein
LYVVDVRTSQETVLVGSQCLTGVPLLINIQMMFPPHKKLAYSPRRPVTDIVLLLSYVGEVPTLQETAILAFTPCYRVNFTSTMKSIESYILVLYSESQVERTGPFFLHRMIGSKGQSS